MIESLYSKFRHWSEEGSVYLISDPHFNDSDTKLMNPNWPSADEYIEKLNKIIHKTDTLICLGDCGDVTFFSKLKAGYKILIKGNHDDKGNSHYQREQDFFLYKKEDFPERKTLTEYLKVQEPLKKISVIDGKQFSEPNKWVGYIDNGLFDEVYDGPLFISDKILLSHEPINGLPFCVNIHGHCHNYYYDYIDELSGKHLNIAADVAQWQPVELKKLIKAGMLAEVPTIHRLTINKAKENPIKK